MYTMAAPVILVVSYGTTRLLSSSSTIFTWQKPHNHCCYKQQTNQINCDTNHGFLIVWCCTILGLRSQKDIINPQMALYPLRSHGTTIACGYKQESTAGGYKQGNSAWGYKQEYSAGGLPAG